MLTCWTDGVDGVDGRRDGGTGHFVFPDLPEHTTTRGASGPKIRNLVTILATVQYLSHCD